MFDKGFLEQKIIFGKCGRITGLSNCRQPGVVGEFNTFMHIVLSLVNSCFEKLYMKLCNLSFIGV